MPNWSYSYANVKHDKKITREEFFDKFSIDGKNVSVPMMMFGDKKIAKDFEWFFKHFQIPTEKHYENSQEIARLLLRPSMNDDEIFKRREAFKIMQPHLEAALANEGYSLKTVIEKIGKSFISITPTILTKAFNSKFGHSLSSSYEMVKLMDWFDTNVNMLGTKWEFELEDFVVEDDEFTFRTETAWCAPDKFFKWISRTFNTTVVSTSEDEDSHGITHNCGWTDEDEVNFDDEKYDEVHWENPDLCFEHRRGLWFENGKKKFDVILHTQEACDEFGTSAFKLKEEGGE